MDLVKSDLKSDTDIKDQQIKLLQETVRNLQCQVMENKSTTDTETTNKIIELESKLKAANVKELLLKTKIVTATKNPTVSSNKSSETEDDGVIDLNDDRFDIKPFKQQQQHIDMDHAKIIGLVSTFLVVHPFGASTDYILSYVHRFSPNLRPKALEEILVRYKGLFTEEITGIGSKIERKWKFSCFDQIN